MPALPNTREFKSADGRRIAVYEPHVMDLGRGKPVAAYRVIRTVRARRGFGTIIHSLTTFTSSKKKAHAMAVRWSKMTTEDRTGERMVRRAAIRGTGVRS